jgi:hypothetical protein
MCAGPHIRYGVIHRGTYIKYSHHVTFLVLAEAKNYFSGVPFLFGTPCFKPYLLNLGTICRNVSSKHEPQRVAHTPQQYRRRAATAAGGAAATVKNVCRILFSQAIILLL